LAHISDPLINPHPAGDGVKSTADSRLLAVFVARLAKPIRVIDLGAW